MATTVIRAPDGRRYRVPSEATQEQVERFLSSLKAPQTPVEAVSSDPVPESVRQAGDAPAPGPAPPEGAAGEQRPEPALAGQTTAPASPNEGRTAPVAIPGVEGSAAALPELVERVASRFSGTARRDPDLRGLARVEVDLVITAGSERVMARVFQRIPKPIQEASP